MKKQLLFILGIGLLISACSQEKGTDSANSNLLENMTVTIDTVRIDAKGEFLFLNMGLYMSDYDPKTDLLYNLNPETSRMEVIDLENNELKELIQYDQDGPNAIKEMFTSGIKITDSGEKWFTDYYSLIHLNAADEKVGQFKLTNQDLPGDTLLDKHNIDGMGKITRSGNYFISHYGDYLLDGEGLQGLAVIDLEGQTKRLIPLDVFKPLDRYKLSSPDGERAGARAGEWNFISQTDTIVIHSNSAQNRLISLNLTSGESREVKLSSSILPDEKPGLYPKRSNSIEQFEEFKELKKQEVTFGPWIVDGERAYFWRISRQKSGGTMEKPVFDFVVTVLDKDLKQMAEIKLIDGNSLPFDGLPSLSFFRDGMLYMFLNIEDELAFIRLKPKFNNP